MMERESLDVDILIVGAGPAGLHVHKANEACKEGRELSVYVLEKGSEVGHIFCQVPYLIQ